MTDSRAFMNSSLSIPIPVSTRTGSLALITKALTARNPMPGIGKWAGRISISGSISWRLSIGSSSFQGFQLKRPARHPKILKVKTTRSLWSSQGKCRYQKRGPKGLILTEFFRRSLDTCPRFLKILHLHYWLKLHSRIHSKKPRFSYGCHLRSIVHVNEQDRRSLTLFCNEISCLRFDLL